LGDHQARARVSSAFSGYVHDKGWRDLRDQKDVVVQRYLGPQAAVVKLRGGKRALVRSLLPLTAGKGRRSAPLDTTLSSSNGAWRPRRALNSYTIAGESRPGPMVSFARSGIDVSLATSVPLSSSEGARQGASLVYPNVARDADAVLKAMPAGVQVAFAIRSPASPQSYRLKLALRDGDLLRAAVPGAKDATGGPQGGAVVLRDGRGALSVGVPAAVDADGRNLVVHTRVKDDTVVYTVDHRDADIHYPILLDPYVAEDQRYWFLNGAVDFNGWQFAASGPGLFGALADYSSAFGRGLYIYTATGINYPTGAKASWSFTAPTVPGYEAEGARIIKADYGYTGHYQALNGGSCLTEGIYRPTLTSYEPGAIWRGAQATDSYTAYDPAYGMYNCNAEGVPGSPATYGYRVHCLSVCGNNDGGNETLGTPGNTAVLGMLQGAGYQSRGGIVFMGSSLIFETEQAAPRITTSGAPSPTAWTKDPFTLAATVNDYGLGPRDANMTAPGATGLPSVTQGSPCTGAGVGAPQGGSPGSANQGDRNHRCTAPLTLQASSGNLADGSYNVTVNATDIVNNPGTANIPVKLDRQPPTIALSGTLYGARNGFIGPGQTVTLQAVATDGALTPAIAQRSGATSVTATIDGQPMTSSPVGAPCIRPEGSCTLTLNTTLSAAQLDELEPGDHTVVITASDALGQTASETLTFGFDNAAPLIELDNSLADYDGEVLTESSYRLIAQALDTDAELYGAGLRDIVVRLDGQVVSTTAAACVPDTTCEQSRAWDWDTTSAANGPHEITITAADRADNQTVETIEIELQRVPDQPQQTSATVRRTIIGASLGDRAGSSTAAVGDVNGDGLADYLVGAPGVSASGRTATGAAYLVLGDTAGGTVDLANPGPSVRRILGPGDNSACGASVAAGGDVNGDGLADLLVGCPGIDQTLGTISSTGSVYVVFGRTDPQAIDLATIGAAGFPIVGPTDSLVTGLPLLTARPAVFGERLQSVPIDADSVTDDVNGDGLSDIVIGDSAVNSAAGSAYVIFGKTDSATVSANALGSGGFIISGARAAGLAGYSATIAGDLDGDTLADILVGEPGQTAATGGRAHIVSGSEATSTVDLAAPGGRAVTLSSGQPDDRFGVNVAALADTDRDGREDIAIATRSGAYIVRDIPTTSRQITADDGYAINGPTNDPGLLSTVPATSIASAGDINADRRADLIIGYPDAAGARAYTVHSPERTRTLNVASLPGQRGTGLNGGTQGDRSGAAVAANADQADAAITDTAQAILGAPAASPSLRVNAGSASILAARPSSLAGATLRAAAQGSAAGCDYTNRTTAYPFDVGLTATFGYQVPVAADGFASYDDSDARLPECRVTTNGRRDEVPRGFAKIARNRRSAPFARNGSEDTANTREEDVVDSKGRVIATLRQQLRGSGDRRSVSRWTVVLPGVDNTLRVLQTAFSVQGYACYVQPTATSSDTRLEERRRFVMVALRPETAAPGPGIRGFIRRTAIKYTSDRALRVADTRCGGPKRAESAGGTLARSGLSSERYQGSSTARRTCKPNYASPVCGALMETYEPVNYPDTITLALSTTGVTGGTDADVAGGGIAMAIVREGDPFKILDSIGYNDPNVPCTATPKVRWTRINANPNSTTRRLYAWLPVKVGEVPGQGPRICPPDARQRP